MLKHAVPIGLAGFLAIFVLMCFWRVHALSNRDIGVLTGQVDAKVADWEARKERAAKEAAEQAARMEAEAREAAEETARMEAARKAAEEAAAKKAQTKVAIRSAASMFLLPRCEQKRLQVSSRLRRVPMRPPIG